MKDGIDNVLKNLRAPTPDPQARVRARRLALEEFARTQAANEPASQDIKLPPLQALLRRLRLSRDDNSHGSTSMKWFNNRGLYAGAAGLGVLAIGLSWVLPNMGRYSEQLARPEMAAESPSGDSSELRGLTGSAPAEAPAGTLPAEEAPTALVESLAAASDDAASRGAAQAPVETEADARQRNDGRVAARSAVPEGPALIAPTAPPAPVADEQASEIVVTGQRAQLAKALETKREAMTVVDAVSAEDIGKFPDKNVGEALQRVAGVQVAQSPGAAAQTENRDRFEHFAANPVQLVANAPVSTFSADVDTASYSFVRAQLNEGRLPQKDAVRVEEMINYFDYAWPAAQSRRTPFRPTIVVSDSPWSKGRKLVHIGIKGYEMDSEDAPDANLVLLLDVSGSMNQPNKLPLAVRSMELLLESLKPGDTVGIVVYAGAAGTVLEPTPAREKAKIVEALRSLRPGGSTAGAAGIELAYELAEKHFRKGGVNRILLATDGDFNVGIAGTEELKGFVERKREKGVYLSVLGFGQGNYRDELAQALAQNGNGVAAYIDSEGEARKVLVQEASGALFTIAKDVKLQVEFNPATVSEYRLVGYETRALKREDFNNDAVDAGDVGAGHTVTAIYEITPAGSAAQSVDEPRYTENRRPAAPRGGSRDEYGFLKIRYKLPDERESRLISEPIAVGARNAPAAVGRDVAFSTAVAGFAQLLRGGTHTGPLGYDDVLRQAQAAKGDDPSGYRAQFIELVRKAQAASGK
jgi:Ca-activated chloride channel family protein